MNLRYSLLALALFPVGSSMAQPKPAASTRPMSATSSTTRTSSTTVSPGSANRQQELYDQYHGITKKPAATATPVTTPAPTRTETTQRQTTEPVRTQPVATSSHSQPMDATGSTSGVRIGIRGGVTSSFFTKDQPGVKANIGFTGGITFNFGGGTFSFQPEVNYTRYSYKVSSGFGSNTGALDELEVPLFLKISSGTYAGNRFFVNVGPYASYLASISTDGKKESLDGVKGRFGFGAAAGIGAALKAGPGHATIEARGLYPLGDTDGGFSTDANTILGQATVGYIFPLGGR